MSTSNAASPDSDQQAAAHAVFARIVAAWAANDADAFAATFTEDATLIVPGGVFLRGRDRIRSFMAAAYSGPLRGWRIAGEPVAGKSLGAGACLLITEGGVLAPGEAEVASGRVARATWTLVERDGEWLVTAYQNTAVGAG